MADTTALKNRIRAAIKANDNQEITGPVLQQSLLDIVDELSGNTDKFALSIGILTAFGDDGNSVISVSGNVLSIYKYDIYTQKFEFIRLAETKTLTLSSGSGIIWYDAVNNILSSAESNFSNNAILIGVHRGNNVYINGVKQYQKDGVTIYCELTANLFRELILSMTDIIPDFVIDAAKATHKRILQWGGTDSYSLLGQITDLHSGGRTTYKHIKYFDGINDLFGFSIICNAGDIGLDVGETEDAAYNLIDNVKNGMSANSLWVFCKGNHDYGTAHISNKIIDNAFNVPYYRRFQERLHGEELGYGYTDDVVNKVRYIYLNTSEGNTGAYTMSVTQVTWLISTLINTPNEYSIVVLSHLCIDDIGRWNSYPNDASANCFIALRSIFSDFVAKTSGSNASLSISWDFTNVDSSIKLVCVLAGDSHFDNYIKRNGVNYIVRQGYGYVSTTEMPSGAVHTDFNTSEQCLFDVLAIKNNGNAKVFRIGAGGAERDLTFTY